MWNPLWWFFLILELVDFFDVSMSETNNKRVRYHGHRINPATDPATEQPPGADHYDQRR
jgi:hypothetical protein